MKLRYCPECAAPLTQLSLTDYRCANGHPYHDNPQADLQLTDSSLNHYDEHGTAADFACACRHWEGTMQPADDVAAVEWKPLEFLRSPEFAWPYPYLYDKLKDMIGSGNVPRS